VRESSALPFKGLAEVAKEAGTARFEMRQVMPELGQEPLSEASGVVDFRERNFAGSTQQVLDGVLYGRKDDGTWTSLELGSREIVGPIWLMLLLRGSTAVEPSEGALEGAPLL
jgi:hypothetical protein